MKRGLSSVNLSICAGQTIAVMSFSAVICTPLPIILTRRSGLGNGLSSIEGGSTITRCSYARPLFAEGMVAHMNMLYG